mmetsp:Transcript_6940/g.6108  ORF Transcript_6940/g.6108 Transcript_6940/m.6108 type:complete len:168 (+) Transcript_6940:291-794(+)
MSGKNNEKYTNEDYTQSVSYNIASGYKGSPKKSIRDFSTGTIRRNKNTSLNTSKDNVIIDRSESSFRSKLPQIVNIDSKKYKTKLMKIESRTDTGLNLTNEDKRKILHNRKQKILDGVLNTVGLQSQNGIGQDDRIDLNIYNQMADKKMSKLGPFKLEPNEIRYLPK